MANSAHMIRLSLDMKSFKRYAADRGLITKKGVMDEGLVLHHVLSETFGKSEVQPFRLMVARHAKRGSVYGYCLKNHKQLLKIAKDIALPEHFNMLSVENIESKLMPCDWKSGRRLGFDIMVRPIRRNDKNGKNSERDAFIVKLEQSDDDTRKPTREEVYKEWLTEKFQQDQGAHIESVHLAKFMRVRVVNANNMRGPEGPQATLHGTLKVLNCGAFNNLLIRGIGRRKAYGYGMILLRPLDKKVTSC